MFTSDDGPVQTSYDTPVIDLTEAEPEVVEAPLEADIEDAEDTVIDLGDSASDSLSQGGTRGAAGCGHVASDTCEVLPRRVPELGIDALTGTLLLPRAKSDRLAETSSAVSQGFRYFFSKLLESAPTIMSAEV